MTQYLDVRLDAIDVPPNRARSFDPVWAEALAAIIDEQGLQHPITLLQVGDRFRLVSGLHRFHAYLHLNRETIPGALSQADSEDQARLQEVMENLGRHELIALDRCHHLFELKQVWERMYPETTKGGNKNVIKGQEATKSQTLAFGSDDAPVMGFARATADKIGLGPSSIKAAVKIWTGLAPQSRARLHGTDLARKQTELKALSELPTPKKQAQVLDLILGEEPVDNVAQALEFLENGVAPNALERRFLAASRVIGALDDITFDSVITAHEARIITSLKLRGRI